MALRLIEIYFPSTIKYRVETAIKECNVRQIWKDELGENQMLLKILIPSDGTQTILDMLDKRFSAADGLRVVILPVEATIPRPEPGEEIAPHPPESKIKKILDIFSCDMAIEELYQDIKDTTRFSWLYIVLIFLSSIVAAVGILRDNVAIIIGAMVIAPLLGPNVALSLATTLGDLDLARRALKASLVGILTALFIAALLGFLLEIDTEISEISSRTEVSLGDIILALAAGSAAGLSFTTRAYSALIGVMVAVALLPPLVVFGMLLGDGECNKAIGALFLLVTNIIGINLAGVITFLVQGIRPTRWCEADKAKKATIIAITTWTILLIILIIIILFFTESTITP